MFKYLFKIYKLRQLMKLRNWHKSEQDVYRAVFSKLTDEGNPSKHIAYDLYTYHVEQERKLENQIKLYE